MVSFFNANLPAGWMGQLDFQAYNPLYNYQATPGQVAALTQNSTWTEDQLIYTLNQNALQGAGSSSSPTTANIIGGTVTLTAGAGIGANEPVGTDLSREHPERELDGRPEGAAGPGHPGG